MSAPARRGHVAIVGGGPGDPGLITVRGLRLLEQADVVVVDRLAPRELLEGLRPEVEIVDVGKKPYCETTTQEQIEAVLVDRASQGLRVVRLKGGDPFVFGRGAEELATCIAAGIDVEVVPGVTSALAGPAAANIPVTHRGVAATFTVVSAHVEPGADRDPVDWAALAKLGGTVVVLMGVARLPAVVSALLDNGRAASTPAAVVESATTDRQRVTVAPLEHIAEAALAAQVRPPAVLVVGEVVGLRDQLLSTIAAVVPTR
ncbi:MAG TPA: uroporphyrinogen-III C-methyltransferase [Mycobacteriales bacterium]|nr:uroporphyrinogen-III C-methyltransferase [Mycobacteriales bacterium]